MLTADFSKGRELGSLNERFQLKSSRRLLVVTFILTGHEAYYIDSLSQLCLITTDGRIFALKPKGDVWASMREDRFDTAKRAAIVSNIGSPQKWGFYSEERPCSSGEVKWSSSLRSKVEEFLLRISTAP
jgi:hypothetical protein